MESRSGSGAAAPCTDFGSEVLPALRAPGAPLPVQGHFSTVLQWALAKLDSGDPAVLPHFAHFTEDFALMYDGYPKGEVHLLVMPRTRIANAGSLGAEHLPLMRGLAAYTAWVLEQCASQRPDLTWRHGVHAVPSLQQLHVHVLSQDFQSTCLKHKKHYNSFQPPFLVPLPGVLAELEATGRVAGAKPAEAEAWLKRDLTCAGCGRAFGSKFAELKRHLPGCRPPPSAPPPWPLAPAAAEPGPSGASAGQWGAPVSPTGKRPRDDDIIDLCSD